MICGIHLSVLLGLFLCLSAIALSDGIHHQHDDRYNVEFAKKSEFLEELLDRLPQKEWKQANDDEHFKRFLLRSVDTIVNFLDSPLGQTITKVDIVQKYRHVLELIIRIAKARSYVGAVYRLLDYIRERNEQYRNSILRDVRQHMNSINHHVATIETCFDKIERLFERSDGETTQHEDFDELQQIIRQIEIEIKAANRNLNDVENDLKRIEREIERLDANQISSCENYAGVSVASGILGYALSLITGPQALLLAGIGSTFPCLYSSIQHSDEKTKIQSDLAWWQIKYYEMKLRLRGYEKRWEELKQRYEYDYE